jgi:transposase
MVGSAEIIGVCERTMLRWRECYEEHGYDGLYDRRKGRPSPKRVPLKRAAPLVSVERETVSTRTGSRPHSARQPQEQ